MRLNHTSTNGSTGLRPVVSGVAPETEGVIRTMRIILLRGVHHWHAIKIRRDAGFHGRDARATTIFE
jgi:hypothetical protein